VTERKRRPKGKQRDSFIDGVTAGAADGHGPVIVVGAGAAGLTAARVLHDQGREVIVVEGRQRIGGRLHTIDVEGGTVDEGGNWIHGGTANPLYHLTQEAGIASSEDNMASSGGFLMFDSVTGQSVNPLRALYHLWRADRLLSRLSREDISAPQSAANLAERLDAEVSRVRGIVGQQYFRFMLRTMNDLTAAQRAELLAPNALALNPDYDSRGDYVIAGGYQRLVSRLESGLDIKLGAAVREIRYDDEGVAVVTPAETFRGSHVIVTVPLGVLKAQTMTFQPALPIGKQRAIQNLGVGTVEKVVLVFDEPYWRKSPNQPRSIFHVSAFQGDFPALIDASSTAGRPVLVAFLTADQAQQLAADPEAMVARATEILRMIFTDDYRDPAAVHITTWGTDEFSLGSYSTVSLTTSASDYDDLKAPVAGRLLFAGEATYRERAGFVEGAIGSGVREARRILGYEAELELPPVDPAFTQ
jgi:polyamine oxidase